MVDLRSAEAISAFQGSTGHLDRSSPPRIEALRSNPVECANVARRSTTRAARKPRSDDRSGLAPDH